MQNNLTTFCLFLILSFAAFISNSVPSGDDIEIEGFEVNNTLRFHLIGFPSGSPKGAIIERTSKKGEHKNGQYALAFRYDRDQKPVPILYDPVLLADFKTLSFWIKSKSETFWVVSMTDRDGAVFSAKRKLPAGKWIKVLLSPDDFTCNQNSPVKKVRLEAKKLIQGYVSFDFQAAIGNPLANEIFIDNVTITGNPLDIITGDYVVFDKNKTIDRPTRIIGNLIVANGAKLTVKATHFEVTGNVKVSEAELIFQDGIWSFPQKYRYQNTIAAGGNGHITFKNGFIILDTMINGVAIDDSSFEFNNVAAKGGGFTLAALNQSSLTFNKAKALGEFLIYKDSNVSIKDSSHLMLWLRCGEKTKAELTMPDEKYISNWAAPQELNRKLTVNNSSTIWWGLIADAGCDMSFYDSTLRAVGINYTKNSRSIIKDLINKTTYDDFTIATEQHRINLINTTVTAWNLYTTQNAELDIHNSVFGETISFNTSKIRIYDSECDGSGGYIGAKDRSSTVFSGGTINANVLTHDQARFIVEDSQVFGPLTATGSSNITLKDTVHIGNVIEIESGKVIKE